MPESQHHGFLVEHCILRTVFKVPDDAKISYTAKDDLPASMNSLCPGENISIKTTLSKRLDMGNPQRILDIDSQTTLIVVQLRQTTATTKAIAAITEVDMLKAKPHLFGSLTGTAINELARMTRAIPRGKHPVLTLAAHAKKAVLNALTGALLLRVKVDSGTQRRIQCAFRDFPAFCVAHPEVVLSHTTTPVLRGYALPPVFTSAPRQRAHSAPPQSLPATDSVAQLC